MSVLTQLDHDPMERRRPTKSSGEAGDGRQKRDGDDVYKPVTSRTTSLRKTTSRGLTLVEVLIVIALIAVMSGAIFFGSGAFSGSRLRAAAGLILNGVRIGTTRANSTGKPVRLVLDLDQHRIILEESSSSVMLREREKSASAGAEAATEAEQKAVAEAERILEGPRAPRARFSPVKQFGFDTDDPSQGRELGRGIQYRQVQTEHDEQPRSEGRAYLYFFPGGGTERAAIQIRRDEEDEGLTVVVSALTGRARVERGRVELPEPRSDGEFSEREEP
jgi:general secretion pathway protein H